jgi:hypothetical protein
MKTLFTIFTLGLGFSFANAQTIKEVDVPVPVKEAFKNQYPTAKVEKWEKEDSNYEVEFKVNKVETSVMFDSNGKFLSSEIEIKVSELPKGILDYVSNNFAGKKVKESSKITNADGNINYEVEIENIDYIFDSNGSLIKKEEDKEKDSDND